MQVHSSTPIATVLVADDDRDTVDSTGMFLRNAGYAVVPAYSVREALDCLDEHAEISLVISDIRMPENDGFDLVRVLRHRFPQLPIILMTGLPVTSDDVVPRGAVIVQKPVAFEELERMMAEMLGTR